MTRQRGAERVARVAALAGILLIALGLGVTSMSGSSPAAERAKKPTGLPASKSALVSFTNSPFPYDGIIPDKDKQFLDIEQGSRRGHSSPRGTHIYWVDTTYYDRRSLIYFPAGFDIHRPAVIVVFFHGNNATLARDVVERQQVPRQLAESGLNAVLIAPQFAVDALDSSSGNFWTPGVFNLYLAEASLRIARLYGDPDTQSTFANMPVIIVAYSGGYNPAAYALAVGGTAGKRIRGVVLLDALYAEEDKFADWLADNHGTSFFFSAFTGSSAPNNAALKVMLTDRDVTFSEKAPATLKTGTVAFLAADPDLPHVDFVTHAWVDDPVKWVLSRVSGYRR